MLTSNITISSVLEPEMEIDKYENYRFSIADYIVFLGVITVSTLMGIYYALFKDKPRTVQEAHTAPLTGPNEHLDFGSKKMSEYLLGSRNLKTFPVAMSLVASYVSGVTIIGTTSEIYHYGTQYSMIALSILVQSFVVSFVYMPVFMKLRVGSSYEYLEMRFNKHVRSIASFLFILDEILFLPFIIYLPALALNQVSGINLHIISGLIVFICVIYTLVGGIKAVVHTDAWQTLVMFISVVAVAVLGTYYSDGLNHIFKTADAGGRLMFFDTTPNLYKRHTLHSVLIGGFFYWTSFNAVNQTMVQRYVALPSLKKGRIAMTEFTVGVTLFILLCCYVGLLAFEKYASCDPLAAGIINHDDQLLPLYVVESVGHIYGMPGLFVAGVFGAALSSLSVVLNSTALVVLEDIVRGTFRIETKERTATIIVKGTIIILGLVGMSLVLVLEKLSGVLSIATSMTAIAAAATFGLFTLGMLIPWSNVIGTAVGGLSGALLAGWISFGSQIASAAGLLNSQKLESHVDGCKVNATLSDHISVDEEQVFVLYRLSYHWINVVGVLTSVIVGAVVSLCTKPTKLKDLDPDLISPVIHRFLPKQIFVNTEDASKSS